MPLTSPTDIYYKSRRLLVLTSFLLLLSIYLNVSPKELFGLKVETPEHLNTILFSIVLYAIWQFIAGWYWQKPETRKSLVNQIDSSVVGFTCIVAAISFFIQFPSVCFFVWLLIGIVIWTTIFLIGIEKIAVIKLKNEEIKNTSIEDVVTSQGPWYLIYNAKTQKYKQISFNPDGNIEEGKNNNESIWRANEGFLEILNEDGKLYSRFRYNKDSQKFEHTNDDDTLSLRHQVICKEEPLVS